MLKQIKFIFDSPICKCLNYFELRWVVFCKYNNYFLEMNCTRCGYHGKFPFDENEIRYNFIKPYQNNIPENPSSIKQLEIKLNGIECPVISSNLDSKNRTVYESLFKNQKIKIIIE